MCSIAGGYNLNNETKSFKDFIDASFDLMEHRGPDNSQVFEVCNYLTLGHQRLSIIDLSTNSNQPKKVNNSVISYNGEIFNYKELLTKHLSFLKEDSSDTEVLIHLLDKCGMSILNELNGMFAFSFFDGDSLFLVRDRFGIKPLYYTIYENNLYFASEFKCLVKILDKFNWNKSFKKSFLKDTATDYDEKTPISEIKQVPAGSYLKISKNKIENQKWYSYNDSLFNKIYFKDKTDKEIQDEFEDLLVDSIKLRLISDVPTCMTLSGGIDSSLIYTLLKERINEEIKVFSFSHLNTKTDESEIVKKLVDGYNDQVDFIFQKKQFHLKEVVDLNKSLEYPSWGIHGLAYNEVYRRIKEKGYTVVIEGHGSDELFGGYPYMIEPLIFKNLQKFRFKNAFKIFNSYLKTIDSSIQSNSKYYLLFKILIKGLINPLQRNFRKNIELSFEYKILPIVLRTFDRLTMNNSIENRSPFLDYRIVEFSRGMPEKFLYDKIGTKAILRRILKKYNKEHIYKIERKMGFSLDMNSFIENSENLNQIKSIVPDFNIKNWEDSFENIKQLNLKIMKTIYAK